MAERYPIDLKDAGGRIHALTNGEGRVYGYVGMEPSGRARIWAQTWHDRFAPTDRVFPGFVSAARAVLRGEV